MLVGEGKIRNIFGPRIFSLNYFSSSSLFSSTLPSPPFFKLSDFITGSQNVWHNQSNQEQELLVLSLNKKLLSTTYCKTQNYMWLILSSYNILQTK